MTYRTLYLVRHGQYDMTVKTQDGGGLTDIGKQQAAYVGKALQVLPIQAIHASTMMRAIETTHIIAQMLQVEYQTTDLLREAIPTIPPRIAFHILHLMEQDPNLTHEAIHRDQQRADEVFARFFVPPPDSEPVAVVLVCHGNLLRYLVCKALNVSSDTWAKLNINHCGITTITVDEEGLMRLVAHNETGHLPKTLLTD